MTEAKGHQTKLLRVEADQFQIHGGQRLELADGYERQQKGRPVARSTRDVRDATKGHLPTREPETTSLPTKREAQMRVGLDGQRGGGSSSHWLGGRTGAC